MTQHDQDRYLAALHALQTGVAAEHERGSVDGSPKQLRVGVNSALVGNAALCRLLLDKGVITMDEYEAAQADQMEAEVLGYEQRLSAELGAEVRLR